MRVRMFFPVMRQRIVETKRSSQAHGRGTQGQDGLDRHVHGGPVPRHKHDLRLHNQPVHHQSRQRTILGVN